MTSAFHSLPSVRTAGDIAEASVQPADSPAPRPLVVTLGDVSDRQVLVSATALGRMLRATNTIEIDLRPTSDWWTVRVPLTGLKMDAANLRALADPVAASLRTWAAHTALERPDHPLVWLIACSTDDELLGWLGLPLR